MKKARIAVLLAGCGVYDGSEIHEAVFTMLAIQESGNSYQCFAPDKPQYHVINHFTGQEESQPRNVLHEAARIARGDIKALETLNVADFDALIIPGGFGAAKNLNQWAIAGPDGMIDGDVKAVILAFSAAGKVLGALCMGPTVLAKAFEDTDISPLLTVGTTSEPSPYDIAAISAGMTSLGSKVVMKTIAEIAVDKKHKIVTAPCYMMEASILQVRENARQLVDAVISLC